MLRKLTRATLFSGLIIFMSAQSFAQAPSAPPASAPGGAGNVGLLEKGKGVSGPRKQLATIVFAGLGGAILGLSTLSFYGRPQEKLQNIAIGGAFGIIAGTVFVTYKAATNPTELYGRQLEIERGQERQLLAAQRPSIDFNWTFEF